MAYASLDELRHHLRYEADENDEMLIAYVQAATIAIKNYITDDIRPEMYPVLKVATLLMVGYLDNNRNSELGEQTGNYLPAAVRQMLAPYRRITV